MAFFQAPNFRNTGSGTSSLSLNIPNITSRQQTSETVGNQYSSPQTGSFAPPSTAFPSWMPTASQFGELKKTYDSLPQAFNTQGMEDSYGRMINNNRAGGSAMAATAARAAQNRARQQGGQVASSFAQGSAMQNVYRQGAEMLSDLEQKKLAARQMQAQAQMQAAGMLGQGRLAQQGQLANYDQGMRNQYMQGQQLGMDQQRINMQGQGLQLDAARLAQSGDQFNRNFGLQSRQQDLSGMIAALQYGGTPSGSWTTNGQGQAASGYDQTKMNQYQGRMDQRQKLIGDLARAGGGSKTTMSGGFGSFF